MRIVKSDDTLEESLYSSIRQMPRDISPLIPWSDKLKPFVSQLREWETRGLIESRAVIGEANEFANGLRRRIIAKPRDHEPVGSLADFVEKR